MAKGWERASIEANTRPNRVKRIISRRDLMIPSGTGVALFGECMARGALFALALFFPLGAVAILLGGDQPWFWWTIGGASLGIGPLIFAYASWDMKDFICSLEES